MSCSPDARGSFVTVTPLSLKWHDCPPGLHSRLLVKFYKRSLSEIEILHAGALQRAIILRATETMLITRKQILTESIWDPRGLHHSPGWDGARFLEAAWSFRVPVC